MPVRRATVCLEISYYEHQQAAEEVVAEVTGAGGRVVAMRADQGSLADQRRLLTEADRLHGGLDILVNNAALARGQRLADVTEDDFDRTMAVGCTWPPRGRWSSSPRRSPASSAAAWVTGENLRVSGGLLV